MVFPVTLHPKDSKKYSARMREIKDGLFKEIQISYGFFSLIISKFCIMLPCTYFFSAL